MRLPAALLFLIAAMPVVAQTPPRRAGLWEEIITRHVRNGKEQPVPPGFGVIRYCVNAESEKRLSQAYSLNSDKCTKLASQQIGQTTISDSACKLDDATTKLQRVVIRNSETTYTIMQSAKYEGGANPTQTQTTIEATWKGDCKDGQKPGDMIWQVGDTMHFRNLLTPQQ